MGRISQRGIAATNLEDRESTVESAALTPALSHPTRRAVAPSQRVGEGGRRPGEGRWLKSGVRGAKVEPLRTASSRTSSLFLRTSESASSRRLLPFFRFAPGKDTLLGARVFGLAGFILVLAVFGGAPRVESVSGQTNTAKSPSNRWLLVVQTSASMQRRAEAVQQIAGAMVMSGMNGQMRRGDTLGLWTFNEKLYTGQFPLQEWTPGTSKEIARRVFEFLKGQAYEKEGPLDAFFQNVERVIKGSDFITVILISDGREKIQYTPFDDKINTAYQTWQKEQEKTSLPFITVLRAQGGQITNCAVTVPPWPLELPPLPPESLPVKPTETKTVEQPLQLAPPLIVSGKKSEPPPNSNAAGATAANAPPSKPAASLPASERSATAATISSRQVNAPATPAQAAEGLPQESFSSRRSFWLMALVLAGLVIGVVLLLMLRSRNSSRARLITRSLDREKKQMGNEMME